METEAVAAPPPLQSFSDLLDDHGDALYGYCVHLARHQADAEDLLQETLIRAMRGHGGLRDRERVRPWLFTIATNAWRDRQRALSRRPATVPLDADAVDEDFSLFATGRGGSVPVLGRAPLDFLRLFRDEDVQAVFGDISPQYRLPLILTTVHGFSCKESAAILDIPLGTILSRLHRGRKQLERGLWDYAVRRGLVKVSDDDD